MERIIIANYFIGPYSFAQEKNIQYSIRQVIPLAIQLPRTLNQKIENVCRFSTQIPYYISFSLMVASSSCFTLIMRVVFLAPMLEVFTKKLLPFLVNWPVSLGTETTCLGLAKSSTQSRINKFEH